MSRRQKTIAYAVVLTLLALTVLLWAKANANTGFMLPVGFYKVADIGTNVKKAYWHEDVVLQLGAEGKLVLYKPALRTSTTLIDQVEDFAVSANGNMAVAYTSAGQLHVIDLKRASATKFFQIKEDTYDIVSIDLSSSGDVMVYELQPLVPQETAQERGLYLLTIDGAKNERILGDGQSPCLDKDGQKIYFIRYQASGENENSLYQFDLMTNQETAIFNGNIARIACSKKSPLVAFVNTDGVSSRVYVYDPSRAHFLTVYYLPAAYGNIERVWWSSNTQSLYVQVQRGKAGTVYGVELGYEKTAVPALRAIAGSISENDIGLPLAIMGFESSNLIDTTALAEDYVDVLYQYQLMSKDLYFVSFSKVGHTLSQPTEKRQRFYFTFLASAEQPSVENVVADSPTEYLVSFDELMVDNYLSAPANLVDLNSIFSAEYRPLSQLLKDLKVSSLAIDEQSQLAAIGYLGRQSGAFLLKTSPDVRTAVQVCSLSGELNMLTFFQGRLVGYYIDASTKRGTIIAPTDRELASRLSAALSKFGQQHYTILPPRVLGDELVVPVRFDAGDLKLYKYVRVSYPYFTVRVSGP
ncbi:hypothetical protein HPY42_02785 [Coprothermobacteraceae bacterium]|nr:hypothetical protein [Coprothermobacteraceae bacterium]